MTTADRSVKRLIVGSVAIAAAAAFVLLIAADASAAKAKFKTGAYSGTTSQGLPLGLDVTKTTVNVVFFDFEDPCVTPMPGLPEPSYAGISGEIKKGKKKAKFKALSPANGYYGWVKGTLKGKKAEGTAAYANPTADLVCGASPSWEAKLSG